MGVTYHGGYPGNAADYTLLDGSTGKVLRVWPDRNNGGYPPVTFVSTDNGLWAAVPPYPAAVYNPLPAVEAMRAQIGAGVTVDFGGGVVVDQQKKLVALITAPPGQVGYPTFTLWVFAIKGAHLLGRTTLPSEPQVVSVAFDPAANRVLVAYLDSVQVFTLNGLHYLATIANLGYQPALLGAGYANRLYDSEPIAVDTTLGRAVVVSGANGQSMAQIIDLASRQVLRTVSVGTQLINVQVDTALHRAYILDTGSCEVNILDLRSEKLVASVPVGPSPLGLAVDEPTGKVFVTQGSGSSSRVLMFPAATTLNQMC
jgi:hypothetical protein